MRAAVVKEGRTAVLEVEINPGRANRARVNKSVLPRTRDLVGLVRTVVFSPEDLALVKGDPSERRRFLDDLLVLRTPRLAGLRADYDRVLKQRNSLLKTMLGARRAKRDDEYARIDARGVGRAARPARGRAARRPDRSRRRPAALRREGLRGSGPWRVSRGRRDRLHADGAHGHRRPGRVLRRHARRARRKDELDRGLTLVGPHRDELAADPGAGWVVRREAAGEGLRQPRRVVVVRAGAPPGGVRPAACGRRRPDPGPGRRVRRARHRPPGPARGPGRRGRAGAGHRRRPGRRPDRAVGGPVRGRRRGGDP